MRQSHAIGVRVGKPGVLVQSIMINKSNKHTMLKKNNNNGLQKKIKQSRLVDVRASKAFDYSISNGVIRPTSSQVSVSLLNCKRKLNSDSYFAATQFVPRFFVNLSCPEHDLL